MSSKRTPSQTIGPFFGFGLPWPDGPNACAAGAPGLVRIFGRVSDGRGDPIPDALVETWQADGGGLLGAPGFRGFARCPTDREGRYAISTVKPGAIRTDDGLAHAPHVALSVFARGLLKRAVTRIYFPDEEAANRADPVLARVADPRARATLVAARDQDGYRFDIHLQGGPGEGGATETVFFEIDD
jgi:protocatechuate 3,4-dioxygenase, alpha subunit